MNAPIARLSRCALALIAAAATACSTKALAPLPQLESGAYPIAQTRNALRVAVDPVMDRERSLAWFGIDCADARILPVLVEFESRDARTSYRVGPSLVSVRGDAKTADGAPLSRDPGETAADVTYALSFVPLLGPVALLAWIGAESSRFQRISDASVVMHQFAVAQLREHTLSPGETEHGAVLLSFAGDEPVPAEIVFEVTVADFAGQPVERFEFPMSLVGMQR